MKKLRELPVNAVQLALSPIAEDPDHWGTVIDRLREAGIEILSGMMALEGEDYSSLESIARTGGVRPDATWAANRAHAEAVADIASRAGIEQVTFHAGFIPEDEGDPERAVLIERLREVADIFGGRNLALAFETGQETAATLAMALDTLDRPNVGVNFDPANMILYGKGDPVAALRTLAPRVRQIHVKDARPTDAPGTWGTETVVGEGSVDWEAFFAIAGAIDPPVDFIIEREAGACRVEDVVIAHALTMRHLSDPRGV